MITKITKVFSNLVKVTTLFVKLGYPLCLSSAVIHSICRMCLIFILKNATFIKKVKCCCNTVKSHFIIILLILFEFFVVDLVVFDLKAPTHIGR